MKLHLEASEMCSILQGAEPFITLMELLERR